MTHSDLAADILNQLVANEPALQNLFSDLNVMKDDKGYPIRFSLKPGECQYKFWQAGRVQYCYSPHPDTKGRFWAWAYKRKGQRLILADLTERASRAAAKRDAYQRYEAHSERLKGKRNVSM